MYGTPFSSTASSPGGMDAPGAVALALGIPGELASHRDLLPFLKRENPVVGQKSGALPRHAGRKHVMGLRVRRQRAGSGRPKRQLRHTFGAPVQLLRQGAGGEGVQGKLSFCGLGPGISRSMPAALAMCRSSVALQSVISVIMRPPKPHTSLRMSVRSRLPPRMLTSRSPGCASTSPPKASPPSPRSRIRADRPPARRARTRWRPPRAAPSPSCSCSWGSA